VAFVNLAGYREDMQKYYFGGSLLVDPNGEKIVGALGSHEHVVFGVITKQTLTQIRSKRQQLVDLRVQGVAGTQGLYTPFEDPTKLD